MVDTMSNNSQVVISVGLDDLVQETSGHSVTSSPAQQCVGSCLNSTTDPDSTLEGLDTTKVVVLSIIIVFTVLGNVAVILAIICRKMKMNRMYYFILHLSLADLLTAFLTLIPEVAWTFTIPYFYGGSALCKMVKFGQMVGPYLSSYVLIMTAVDRYQAICYPLSNCTWTPRRSNIMIGTAWAISLLLCVPQAVIFSEGHDEDGGPRCAANFVPGWGLHAYVAWFAVSNFFLPLVFLLFCYSRICWAIWENFNNKKISSAENGSLSSREGMGKTLRDIVARFRRIGKSEGQVIMRYRFKTTTSEIKDYPMVPDEDSDNSRESADKHWQEKDKNESKDVATFQLKSPQTRVTIEPPSRPAVGINAGGGCVSHITSGINSIDEEDGIKTLKSSKTSHNPGGKAVFFPRSSSVKGISRAKIKTVKLTVVVIVGYIVCSAPFICVQLWATFGSPSEGVLSSMVWLFWLLTLNSVVNPWIYMMFNANLVESLCRIFCRSGISDCITTSDCNRCHRNVRQSRLFGQVSKSSDNNGTKVDTTGLSGNYGLNLTARDQKSYGRSRSNSGASQTSFTMVTTAEGFSTNGAKKSPSLKDDKESHKTFKHAK